MKKHSAETDQNAVDAYSLKWAKLHLICPLAAPHYCSILILQLNIIN